LSRKLLSITLVFLMMLQSLHHFGVISYYKLNTERFIENFCINKNKPNLCCKGKCFLNKTLEQTAEADGKHKKINPSPISFYLLPVHFILLSRPDSFVYLYQHLNNLIFFDFKKDLDRPPERIA
jgi:hypothetical protein